MRVSAPMLRERITGEVPDLRSPRRRSYRPRASRPCCSALPGSRPPESRTRVRRCHSRAWCRAGPRPRWRLPTVALPWWARVPHPTRPGRHRLGDLGQTAQLRGNGTLRQLGDVEPGAPGLVVELVGHGDVDPAHAQTIRTAGSSRISRRPRRSPRSQGSRRQSGSRAPWRSQRPAW